MRNLALARYLLMAGILALFVVVLLACGGAEEPEAAEATEPPPPTATTAAPTAVPTEAPTEAAMEEEPTEAMMEDEDADLKAAAAALAGGPGAFFVGDLDQLVGPVPSYIEDDIGDNDGVPYEGLEDYLYVFDSDYYRTLVERANYANPTQVTTTGESFEFQLACINRALTHCKLAEWWSDEVYERTNGQLKIEVVGYPELGISGEDVLELDRKRHPVLCRAAFGLHRRRPARNGYEIPVGNLQGQSDVLRGHSGRDSRSRQADRRTDGRRRHSVPDVACA